MLILEILNMATKRARAIQQLLLVGSYMTLILPAMVRTQTCPSQVLGARNFPLLLFGIDERIPHSNQAIVASYVFQCCGTITEWATGVSSGLFDEFDIKLQVWRPSPTTVRTQDGTCYSLAGENQITSTRAFPAGTVQHTPTVKQRIAVQAGDVVGFIMEGNNLSNDAGVLLVSTDARHRVWYGASEIGPSSICQNSISDTSKLQSVSLAPLIRISLATTDCTTQVVQTSSTSQSSFIQPQSTTQPVLSTTFSHVPSSATPSPISPTPTSTMGLSTSPTPSPPGTDDDNDDDDEEEEEKEEDSEDEDDFSDENDNRVNIVTTTMPHISTSSSAETSDSITNTPSSKTSSTNNTTHTSPSDSEDPSISTSSPGTQTLTSKNGMIITIASGVGVLVLCLFNLVLITSIFIYRKSRKAKDETTPNPRYSLTSMVYNSVYNNGSTTNTMETTVSCNTREHIYSEVN